MAVFLGCLPEDAPGSWIVEWVATAPRHRGRGLVQDLLAAEFDAGRQRGHELSQIMILSGNLPAQRAYELKKPVKVKTGDTLYLECRWNNTDAAQPVRNGTKQKARDVNWGWGTSDGMCLGILYATRD